MPTLLADSSEHAQAPPEQPPVRTHHGSWRHFTRHYVEMALAMTIGMVAAVTVFMYGINIFIERIKWDEVLTKYPVPALVAVAIGMSIPMILWMRWRGHSRKDAYEMGAVMGGLAVPFICLALLDVVDGAQCALYCVVGYVGMLGLMIIRRDRYMGQPTRAEPAVR